MAVNNVSSLSISNRDASPPVLNNPAYEQGIITSSSDFAAVTNGDSIGSVYKLLSVPSNARVSSLKLTCDAITSAAANIGLSQTTAAGGAAVSASLFASAQSLASALNDSQILNQAGNVKAANRNQMVWQLLGLSADPVLMYDIVATLTAAATATGNLALEVTWSR